MKKTVQLIFLFLLVFSLGCKKDKKDPSSDPTKQQQDNNPTVVDTYIKADLNGSLVNATSKGSGTDHLVNGYDTGDDEAQMIRFVPSTGERWSFYFEKIDFDTIAYPKTLKYSGVSGVPSVDVTYNNGNDGAVGNFLSDHSTPSAFTVTLTSWSNDQLEGTFAGSLESGYYTDSTVAITNGEFKIKMSRY